MENHPSSVISPRSLPQPNHHLPASEKEPHSFQRLLQVLHLLRTERTQNLHLALTQHRQPPPAFLPLPQPSCAHPTLGRGKEPACWWERFVAELQAPPGPARLHPSRGSRARHSRPATCAESVKAHRFLQSCE